jgi:hypothetical protein
MGGWGHQPPSHIFQRDFREPAGFFGSWLAQGGHHISKTGFPQGCYLSEHICRGRLLFTITAEILYTNHDPVA